MFSAFQSNSFQSNAFQIGSGTPPAPAIETKGGIDERDYYRYRQRLERLIEVATERRKYIATASEDAEALLDLPIDTQELEKITKGPQLKGTLKLTPDIDFSALIVELLQIQRFLDEQFKIQQLREADDEAAFILLLQ